MEKPDRVTEAGQDVEDVEVDVVSTATPSATPVDVEVVDTPTPSCNSSEVVVDEDISEKGENEVDDKLGTEKGEWHVMA